MAEWNKGAGAGFSTTTGRAAGGDKMGWSWTWSIFLALLIPCIFLHHRLRSSAGDAAARTGPLESWNGTFVEALVNGVMWAAVLTAILGFVI
jgi:hypothetical protein